MFILQPVLARPSEAGCLALQPSWADLLPELLPREGGAIEFDFLHSSLSLILPDYQGGKRPLHSRISPHAGPLGGDERRGSVCARESTRGCEDIIISGSCSSCGLSLATAGIANFPMH